MNNRNKENNSNILLILAVFMLGIISLVFIYSASNYSALSNYNDSFYFVKKQAFGLLIGGIVMFFLAKIDYHFFKKINLFLAILTLILLVLVFIPGVGVENYGAKRWIGFFGITVQPSEIAKFSLILFCSCYISKYPERGTSLLKMLPVILFGLTICLLIILEPNMSITICVLVLLFTMLFLSGLRFKTFLLLLVPAFIVGCLLILIEPYRLKRLLAFIDPWQNPKGEGYQLLQSLYALGSGGFFGVGIFNSRQKYAFLPFAESDFILSVIGEEVGFVGTFFLFSIYFYIIIKGLLIAKKSQDILGFFIATGISMIIGIQTVINALVVTGSIPPTGLPLPLLSSGNTSIIIFMAELGILINISKNKV